MTIRPLIHLVCLALLILGRPAVAAPFPQPSRYPISWELDFVHAVPERIVVDTGNGPPRAYWYVTYTVTNNTGQERTFLPWFEMLTKDGKIIRSDQSIPFQVFEAIKHREGSKMLEPFTQMGGEILLGEDQAKDGVAIWLEPTTEMGRFSIFVTGLCGEAITMTDDAGAELSTPEGKPIILRKTLQLNYMVPGDELYPEADPVAEEPLAWVMR
jgi:hypothetical protein